MVNEQLASYIRQQLAGGSSKDDISKAALAVGWHPSDLNEAFSAIEVSIANATSQAPLPAMTNISSGATQALSAVSSPSTFQVNKPSGSGHFSKRFAITAVVVSCIVLVASGAVAYAYFQQIGPFSVVQYTENSFLSDVLAKSSQINSASYVLSASLSVDQRDTDATAFVEPPTDEVFEVAHQNDARRMSDVSSLLSGLRYKYGEQKTPNSQTKKYTATQSAVYPAQLSIAEIENFSYSRISNIDPTTEKPYSYVATEGGKNFALSVTFETNTAINKIRSSYGYAATTTVINGQKVTFTKDSTGYSYFSPTPPKPLLVTLADSLRSIPQDVSGSVAIGATTDFHKEGFPDWRFNAAAEGSFGDLTYKVDVEALKKDANYYVRINKIPSLPFLPFANYKGQWIEITPTTASSSATGSGRSSYNEFSSLASGISDIETNYKKGRTDFTNALRNIVQLADTRKLIVFKAKPIKETVDGRDLYRYQLDMKKEAIIPFYKDLLADPEKYKKLGVTQDQGLLDYLQSKEFDDVFAYIQNNTYLTLWTDTEGFPAILEYRLRIVPPDTATQLKDKQINIILKLAFSDINKSVNIEAPKNTKSIETVIDEMDKNTGGSLVTARMKGNDAAVQSDLDTIRTQAEIYYGGDGKNSYGTQAWVSGAATLCKNGMFRDTTITKAITAADSINGDGKDIVCYANGEKYLVGAALSSSGWWCVDSTGMSRRGIGNLPKTAPKNNLCP